MPYLDEKKLGVAVLQRRSRLQNQLAKQKSDKHDQKPPHCSLSPRTEKDNVLKQELTILGRGYWEHQIRLDRIDHVQPAFGSAVEEVLLLRQHRDRHNRRCWIGRNALSVEDAADAPVAAVTGSWINTSSLLMNRTKRVQM